MGDTVGVLVCYNGTWVTKQNISKYEGGEAKGIIVSRNITFLELTDRVYNIACVDRSRSTITLKYSVPISVTGQKHIKIEDDNDVQYFLKYNTDVIASKVTPLLSSFELREVEVLRSNVNVPNLNYNIAPSALTKLHSNEINGARLGTCGSHVELLDKGWTDLIDMISFEEEEGESTCLNEAEAYSAPSVLPQLDFNVESSMMLPHVEPCPKPPQPSKKQKKGRNCDEVEYNSRPQDIHYDRGLSCLNWEPNLKAGKLFSSKAALQKTLCLAAIRGHFKLRTELSSKSRLVVRCSQENFPWRVRGSKVGANAFFVVKYNAIHKCDLWSISKSHHHSVRGVLSDAVKWRFRDSRTIYSPGDIKTDVKHRFGFTISYSTTWRSRELALQTIRGSPEESFRLLPSYCYELERANPGTLTYVHTDPNHHFLYFFMAIGACIRGLKSSMRPVLAVDATHLKSKYKGILFVATAFDGNRNIYPVAFGIGDLETDASWEWFFSKLRLSIGDCPNLVVV